MLFLTNEACCPKYFYYLLESLLNASKFYSYSEMNIDFLRFSPLAIPQYRSPTSAFLGLPNLWQRYLSQPTDQDTLMNITNYNNFKYVI